MNNAHMDVEVRSIKSDEYEPFIRAMKLGFGDHTTEGDIRQSKEEGLEPDRAIAAFHQGKIVEVIPVNRLSVLLAILFSWLFFRKQEAVNFRVVLGGLLSVAGAWAIVWGK